MGFAPVLCNTAPREKSKTVSLGENREPGRQAWGRAGHDYGTGEWNQGNQIECSNGQAGAEGISPFIGNLFSLPQYGMGFILGYIWVKNPLSLVMPETSVVPVISHTRISSEHLLAK